jgi:indole-3-glycerol phosphate synthase
MENFLEKILAKKRQEIELLKKEKPLKIFYDEVKLNISKNPKIRDFKTSITREKINIIAEIKKASPSKGDLLLDMDVVDYALLYEQAGASAISVLTEKNFFKGSLDDLVAVKNAVNIPVLRKDFVIDAYQIFEAKFSGADAILLIADVLDEKTLTEFLVVCKYLAMDALVEVHEEKSLQKAIASNAEIIGINNRCLKDFSVDINTTIKLSKLIPDDKIVVTESGIFEKEHLRFILENCKVKTFLIGESIVKSSNPSEKIKTLLDPLS